MDIPFVIIKGKSRLGALVRKKKTSVVAVTDVEKGDMPRLQQFIDMAMTNFNEKPVTKTGGLQISKKSIDKAQIASELKKSKQKIV